MAERKPYSSHGRCLYCAKPFAKLTREHIVPEGLQGGWWIVGACATCARKSNEEYENLVLQSDMVRTMRAFLKLKRKKRKNQRPILMPPKFKHGTAGQTKIQTRDYLEPDDFYPRIFVMLLLEPAMKLTPNDKTPIEKRVFRTWFRNIEDAIPGPAVISDPVNVGNAYVSDKDLLLAMDITGRERSVSIRQNFPLKKFMRMLAKIAYCFAVAERGLDRFDGTEIQHLVCGERDDFHNFVGGSLNGDRLTNRVLHHLAFRERGDLLTVIVHLFSSYDAPPYEVVVGSK
jgi:hypothetical protein